MSRVSGILMLIGLVGTIPENNYDNKEENKLPADGKEKTNMMWLKMVQPEILKQAKMTIPQLIKYHGYPIEVHNVTTIDGYVLTLHRIPNDRKDDTKSYGNKNNRIVFLQHGILDSSAVWIISGPGNALAYILADQGYDVWLGNFRGNRYSRNHTKLDPDIDKSEFWNFSWHELGAIDLPTMIDFVLEKTRTKQLFYIGHSQGTTTFYVMCSMRPEYNQKIIAHVSMAPVAYMKHMTSPVLKEIAWLNGAFELLFGIDEFVPKNGVFNSLITQFCSLTMFSEYICTYPMFLLTGFDNKRFNNTLLPLIMANLPAGASTKQIVHYGQLVNIQGDAKFRQYDHGPIVNMIKYKQTTPPDYDLKKITAPIYLFYSKNDWLSNTKDIEKLYADIGNAKKQKYLVADQKFTHVDYLYAIDVRPLVYNKIIDILNSYK